MKNAAPLRKTTTLFLALVCVIITGSLALAVIPASPTINLVVPTFTGTSTFIDKDGAITQPVSATTVAVSPNKSTDYLKMGYTYKYNVAFGNNTTSTCTKGAVIYQSGTVFACNSTNRMKPIVVTP